MRRQRNDTPHWIQWLYESVFTLFLLLSAPFYLSKMWRRGRWREGFAQRFGRYSSKIKQSLTNRPVLWFHAVSVGEVNLCTHLIQAVEHQAPSLKIVVSTTTSTGMQQLQKRLPSRIQKIYYPIDRRRFVSRALKALRPSAIVLVEAEIWPNLLWAAKRRHIPVFLVNARLSERSFRGYRRLGFLFEPLFASFTGIGVQNESDASRFKDLGSHPDAIRIVGSLKFDAATLQEHYPLDVPTLLSQIGVSSDRPILVGGSTHAGEEKLLAEVYQALKPDFPDLFLILVPRHFERGKEVGQQLRQLGIPFLFRSEIRTHTRAAPNEIDCLLVNTTGELKNFYQAATLIFVGKSLTSHGGQNPIEPASLRKPILFGPHMENFAHIAPQFLTEEAAIQVHDQADLQEAIASLLRDPNRRDRLAQNAKRVVDANQGAAEKTCQMILKHLPSRSLYL